MIDCLGIVHMFVVVVCICNFLAFFPYWVGGKICNLGVQKFMLCLECLSVWGVSEMEGGCGRMGSCVDPQYLVLEDH